MKKITPLWLCSTARASAQADRALSLRAESGQQAEKDSEPVGFGEHPLLVQRTAQPLQRAAGKVPGLAGACHSASTQTLAKLDEGNTLPAGAYVPPTTLPSFAWVAGRTDETPCTRCAQRVHQDPPRARAARDRELAEPNWQTTRLAAWHATHPVAQRPPDDRVLHALRATSPPLGKKLET